MPIRWETSVSLAAAATGSQWAVGQLGQHPVQGVTHGMPVDNHVDRAMLQQKLGTLEAFPQQTLRPMLYLILYGIGKA